MDVQELDKAAEEEAAKEHDIARGNPLLNPKSDFNVKRRYVALTSKSNIHCQAYAQVIGGMTMLFSKIKPAALKIRRRKSLST